MHSDAISTHAPEGAIIVPDAQLLFNGDFKRSGVDLVLSKGDQELVLHDYFKGEKRPALASPDGAHLTGDVVNALAGHTQFAQADGSASTAAVIGHVTKLVGTATAIRNGVAIILNQGDNVNKGDVVQSGSDSTLGITFIDGTVFGLASNAKMVLNEMVYDPNGSNNSALLSLVQGTISFVAGATAKHGDMKVDTPVATMGIRGTAVLVEIDFEVSGGNAPPAKFQVLVEPDGTTGSYILFDKTTLTPIATVNQAGTQTIISGNGGVSFLSSTQLSPDAQNLINQLFALKFTDANPKSPTHFTDTIIPETTFGLKLPDGSYLTVTPQYVFVPDGPSGNTPGPARGPDHISGPPTVVALSAAFSERSGLTHSSLIDQVTNSISYLDINAPDRPTASAQFDSHLYKNAANQDVTASLTAKQLAAITAVEVPLQIVQDPAGKNHGVATWTYSAADGAFDFLAAGETLTLTYMVRVDNNYGPFNEFTVVPITVTITGTNDTPVITSAVQTASLTEIAGVQDSATADVATGTISFTDVDLTDKHAVTVSGVSASGVTSGLANHAAQLGWLSLGSLTDSTDGVTGSDKWTFSAADHYFDYLADGESVTLTYTIQVDDHHGGLTSQDVTVTVTGTNDAPVFDSAPQTASINEIADTLGSSAADTATGTIAFTDVDLSDTHTVTITGVSASGTTTGLANHAAQLGWLSLGSLSLRSLVDTTHGGTGSEKWTFSAADHYFDYLADGESVTLTYTVQVDDHHGGVVSEPVTVTIHGSNDAAVFTGDAQTGTITEIADVSSSTSLDTAHGAITFNDADLSDTHVVKVTGVTASGSTADVPDNATLLSWLSLGKLTDSTGGATASQDWTFSAQDKNFDYLRADEKLTLTYTVEVDDGHGGVVSTPVTITITGTNDAPVIVGETDAPIQTVIVSSGHTSVFALAPGVNTNSQGLATETFNDQTAGSLTNNGAGSGNFHSAALDATFSGLNHAGVVKGTLVHVSTAPNVGPSGAPDATNYMSVGTGGTETITFGSEKNTFGLYWGTVDPSNKIDFYHGTTLVASYTGAEIAALLAANPGQFPTDRYIEFSGLAQFDKVVLSSNVNAFELDNISAGLKFDHHAQLDAPITGTLSVHDADVGDTLTASVLGNATFEYAGHDGSTGLPPGADISALIAAGDISFDTVQSDGGTQTLHWTYNPANPNLDFLEAGDSLTIHFAATVNDGHGNVGNQPLTIKLVGADTSQDIAGPAVVSGTAGDETFNIAGNATVFGGGGHDTFVFKPNFGNATIADFDATDDAINISKSLFASVADILAAATPANSGHDTVITDAAHDVITLKGVSVAQLHAATFHLV